MGRLSAVFIAFCMLLIAGSVGIVSYPSFGFTGMEATVIAIAVMTALVMINSVTGRQRDRYDIGAQIADLSRGTADMAARCPNSTAAWSRWRAKSRPPWTERARRPRRWPPKSANSAGW